MSRLLLLPNSLAEEISPDIFSPEMAEKISHIDGLIAESERRARRFLKCFSYSKERSFRDIPIRLLNEHTKDLEELLQPLQSGETWGLISDGGLPCLADPGANLVAKARRKSIEIEVFPGPSSMIYTLMLSGFPAQSFAFHGYFPKDKEKRERLVIKLTRRSLEERAPQIFIEAPYRCHHRLQELVLLLPDNALLCIGCDIMEPTQSVMSLPIHKWKKIALPDVRKRPTVFIFYMMNSATSS